MTVQKIYFDMDGVLADFDRGVAELCHLKIPPINVFRSIAEDNLMWRAIGTISHFYGRLELMPGAKEMFDTIYGKYGDRCEILTGIPRPKRGILHAGEDKEKWVRRMLSDQIQVNIVYREEKLLRCTGPDCILIDDLELTIAAWQKRGGTGILHTGAEDTIRQMQAMGLL